MQVRDHWGVAVGRASEAAACTHCRRDVVVAGSAAAGSTVECRVVEAGSTAVDSDADRRSNQAPRSLRGYPGDFSWPPASSIRRDAPALRGLPVRMAHPTNADAALSSIHSWAML